MRRTVVQFDEATYRKLRQQAFRQARSISSLVREMVARGLAARGESLAAFDGRCIARLGATPHFHHGLLAADRGRKERARVSQFSSVRAGRSNQGRLSPVSQKHDEALDAVFEK